MKKNKFLLTLVLSSSCLLALASCQGAQGQKGDKGEPGINGTDGTNGKDGTNGSSVLTGKGTPSSTLGSDNDSYIDTDTFDFYSKSNGTWTKYGNIKGSDGSKGEDGSKGDDGKQGTSVLTGSGEPASTLGNDGDSYIDIESFDFYTKADGTWSKVGSIKGDKGDQGEKGDKGNSGWSGSKGDKGDTAWSNTILSSSYGYITPSAGSVVANGTNTISFTVHHNNYDKYRCSELVLNNPTLEEPLVISASDESVVKNENTNDYTFTTTMLKGGFVVSANYVTKNLKISLPTELSNGKIEIEGATGSEYYFPGDKVTLKITADSKFRLKKDSFKVNDDPYDSTKLEQNGNVYTYEATIGENGLDIKLEFEEDSDLAYSVTEDENGEEVCTITGLGNYTIKEGKLIIPNEIDGKKVVAIADYSFMNNTSFTSISIPGSVKTIGNSAFYNCHTVTSVTINEGVVTIGDSAFYRLILLTSIDIPSTVTTIESEAFRFCYLLNNVTLSEGLITIGSYAFDTCWGGDSGADTQITNRTIKIPSTVKSIGYQCFYWCKKLESIIIPTSVKTIETKAFDNIDALKVYYYGIQSEASSIKDENDGVNDTSGWYFYSEGKPEDTGGKYWYYKEGVPTSWNNN